MLASWPVLLSSHCLLPQTSYTRDLDSRQAIILPPHFHTGNSSLAHSIQLRECHWTFSCSHPWQADGLLLSGGRCWSCRTRRQHRLRKDSLRLWGSSTNRWFLRGHSTSDRTWLHHEGPLTSYRLSWSRQAYWRKAIILRARRKFCHLLSLQEAKSRIFLCSNATRWPIHIFWGTHHRNHKPAWSTYSHDFP